MRLQQSAGLSLLLRCTTLSNEPNLLISISPWEGPVGYLPQEKARQANKQDALLICWSLQGTLPQSISLGFVLPTLPRVVVTILHSIHLRRPESYRTMVEKGFWTPNSLRILYYNNCNFVQRLLSKTMYFWLASVHVLSPYQSLTENKTLPQTN